jgi:hypothetical protein
MEWLVFVGLLVVCWLFAGSFTGDLAEAVWVIGFVGVLAAPVLWLGLWGALISAAILFITVTIAARSTQDPMLRMHDLLQEFNAMTTPQLLERLEDAKTRTQQQADRRWRRAAAREQLVAGVQEAQQEIDIIRRAYAEHPNEECAVLRKARSGVERKIIDAALVRPGSFVVGTAEVTRPDFRPTLCTCNGYDPEAQQQAEEEWLEAILKRIPESLKRVQEIQERQVQEPDVLDEA